MSTFFQRFFKFLNESSLDKNVILSLTVLFSKDSLDYAENLRKLKIVREYIRNDYTFQKLLIKAYYLNPEIIIEELENTYPVRLTQEEREAYIYIINNKQEKIKKYRLI